MDTTIDKAVKLGRAIAGLGLEQVILKNGILPEKKIN